MQYHLFTPDWYIFKKHLRFFNISVLTIFFYFLCWDLFKSLFYYVPHLFGFMIMKFRFPFFLKKKTLLYVIRESSMSRLTAMYNPSKNPRIMYQDFQLSMPSMMLYEITHESHVKQDCVPGLSSRRGKGRENGEGCRGVSTKLILPPPPHPSLSCPLFFLSPFTATKLSTNLYKLEETIPKLANLA